MQSSLTRTGWSREPTCSASRRHQAGPSPLYLSGHTRPTPTRFAFVGGSGQPVGDGFQCRMKNTCFSVAQVWVYRMTSKPYATPSCMAHAEGQKDVRPFWGSDIKGVTPPTASESPTPSALREWARANGWEVGDRGRISQEIREAYAEDTKAS